MSTTEAPPTEQDAKQPEEKPKCLSKEQVLDNCRNIAAILEHTNSVFGETLANDREDGSTAVVDMLNAVLGKVGETRYSPTMSDVHRKLSRFHALMADASANAQMDPVNSLIKTAITMTVHVTPVMALVNAALSEGEYELRLVKVEKPAPPAAVDEEPAEPHDDGLPL